MRYSVFARNLSEVLVENEVVRYTTNHSTGNRLQKRLYKQNKRVFRKKTDKDKRYTIHFVVDVSGSMEGDRIRVVKDILNELIPLFNSQKVVIHRFDDTATIISSVHHLHTGGGTNFQGCINHLGRTVIQENAIVVVFTDGGLDAWRDENTHIALDRQDSILRYRESIQKIKKPFFGIGIEHDGIRQVLRESCVVENVEECREPLLYFLSRNIIKL